MQASRLTKLQESMLNPECKCMLEDRRQNAPGSLSRKRNDDLNHSRRFKRTFAMGHDQLPVFQPPSSSLPNVSTFVSQSHVRAHCFRLCLNEVQIALTILSLYHSPQRDSATRQPASYLLALLSFSTLEQHRRDHA